MQSQRLWSFSVSVSIAVGMSWQIANGHWFAECHKWCRKPFQTRTTVGEAETQRWYVFAGELG